MSAVNKGVNLAHPNAPFVACRQRWHLGVKCLLIAQQEVTVAMGQLGRHLGETPLNKCTWEFHENT